MLIQAPEGIGPAGRDHVQAVVVAVEKRGQIGVIDTFRVIDHDQQGFLPALNDFH
jgi:hypothetical protein